MSFAATLFYFYNYVYVVSQTRVTATVTTQAAADYALFLTYSEEEDKDKEEGDSDDEEEVDKDKEGEKKGLRSVHSLVILVLGRVRSRMTVASALAHSDVCNLAVSSVDCLIALLPEEALGIRNLSRVSDKAKHGAYRPVVSFAGPWHGRDAFLVSAHRFE